MQTPSFKKKAKKANEQHFFPERKSTPRLQKHYQKVERSRIQKEC